MSRQQLCIIYISCEFYSEILIIFSLWGILVLPYKKSKHTEAKDEG